VTDQQQSGITRREMLKRGAIFGGAVVWATPVVQTVGMRRALAQAPSDNCIPDNWAIEMVLNQQGVRLDGTAVLAGRSAEANALGNNNDFFSLGFGWNGQATTPGGVIRVRLAQPAFKHTGSEVLVVEATGGDYPLERAEVWVSPNNSIGSFAGHATNQGVVVGTDRFQTILPFPGDVDVVRYVTLIDVTNPAVFGPVASYNNTTMPDGFDVVRVGTGCREN
jgi:hypothetical protein